ncbi:unnamed protein product [Choristocarpus tenellus]
MLGRLAHHGIYAAGDKTLMFTTETTLYGKIYTGQTVRHDPVHLQGLIDLRSFEIVRELMQFLQAVNWLKIHLPHMSETVEPLLLERRLAGVKCQSKRVASTHPIHGGDWSLEQLAVWTTAQKMISQVVELSHPRRSVLC